MQGRKLIVELCLDKNNIISFVKADGHAGRNNAGSNIVCAGVTAVLRAAYRTVLKNSSIKAEVTAKKEGSLEFYIIEYKEDQLEWLKGITDFLYTGIEDIEKEYPDFVKLLIFSKNEKR